MVEQFAHNELVRVRFSLGLVWYSVIGNMSTLGVGDYGFKSRYPEITYKGGGVIGKLMRLMILSYRFKSGLPHFKIFFIICRILIFRYEFYSVSK